MPVRRPTVRRPTPVEVQPWKDTGDFGSLVRNNRPLINTGMPATNLIAPLTTMPTASNFKGAWDLNVQEPHRPGFQARTVNNATPEPLPGLQFKNSGGFQGYVNNGYTDPVTKQPQVAATNPEAPVNTGNVWGSMAKKAGDYVTNNPATSLNAAMGLFGALQYAGAKRPEPLAAPEKQHSQIPITSYEDDLRRMQSANAENAAAQEWNLRGSAGSDTQAYNAGLKDLQLNRSQADRDAVSSFTNLRRQDDINAANTINADNRYNFETNRSFEEAKYNQAMQEFGLKRQQGQQMAQGSLDYMLDKDQADRQYDEKVKQQQLTNRGIALEEELKQLSIGLEDQFKSTDPAVVKAAQDEYQRRKDALYQQYEIMPPVKPVKS